jgi:hypothetical protein
MPRLLVLFLCAGLAAALGCVEQKDFDLDPRPHRDVISSLENLLYAPSPPKIETTEQIMRMGKELANSLDGGRPPVPSKKAAIAVRAWAEGLSIQGEAGYVTLDLAAARKSWEAVRDANFRPENFFKIATGDLDGLQKSKTGRVDSMQLTLITLAAGELTSILEKGRLEAETFDEIPADMEAGSPEAIAVKTEWDRWVTVWERKIDSVDWPERPPLAAQEVGAIFQQLKNAEKELVQVTGPHESGVTPKDTRILHIAEAGELIEAAHARIVALRR